MFRHTVLKRTSEPLSDIAKVAWRVENKHLAGAAVGFCSLMFGFCSLLFVVRTEVKSDITEVKSDIRELRTEMKELRMEMKNDNAVLRAELKADIQGLAAEIRTSLAGMNSARGAMEAHAQFFRDANAGGKAAP